MEKLRARTRVIILNYSYLIFLEIFKQDIFCAAVKELNVSL